MICGVCNLEMPEPKFDDHRYAEHIGLARPYGMSQVSIIYLIYINFSIIFVIWHTFVGFLRFRKKTRTKTSFVINETSFLPILFAHIYFHVGFPVPPVSLSGRSWRFTKVKWFSPQLFRILLTNNFVGINEQACRLLCVRF